jgi:3-hydroxy-9,10-secoandrosta-1,3,5(10)-triene-9,17-dione monooxygenase reductase component
MSACLAETSPAIDPKALRSALGAFSTGVTIVTTLDGDGVPVGVTANSFSSVSLDPPLILWSLAKNARSHAVYSSSRHWVVNVLSQDQVALSNRFAQRGEDKFAGVSVSCGVAGVPVLDGLAACFQCETWARYDGGDHTIFVGRVLQYARSQEPPLVFHDGQYAVASPKADA